MKISDQMKGKGNSGSHAPGGVSSVEGGDLSLAMTSTVQGQATQMVMAAQAAQISIDHASTKMAEYFTQVMSGQALLDATLAKTAAKLEAMGGPVVINTEVQPIALNLPESRNFEETRTKFLGMFGSNTHDIPAYYIISGPDNSDSEGEDNV